MKSINCNAMWTTYAPHFTGKQHQAPCDAARVFFSSLSKAHVDIAFQVGISPFSSSTASYQNLSPKEAKCLATCYNYPTKQADCITTCDAAQKLFMLTKSTIFSTKHTKA